MLVTDLTVDISLFDKPCRQVGWQQLRSYLDRFLPSTPPDLGKGVCGDPPPALRESKPGGFVFVLDINQEGS